MALDAPTRLRRVCQLYSRSEMIIPQLPALILPGPDFGQGKEPSHRHRSATSIKHVERGVKCGKLLLPKGFDLRAIVGASRAFNSSFYWLLIRCYADFEGSMWDERNCLGGKMFGKM